VPAFITSSPENPPKALFELLLDHVDHIVKVGGIDSVGFGSDFDGFKEIPDHKVIASPADFPRFVQGFERRGYRAGEIEKIMGGNWTRLIVEILR
jgi:membrane dipeptidase